MSIRTCTARFTRDVPSALREHRASLLSLLRSWELYLILAAALFLRLYHINLTEFDADQATIFQMAHDAVSQGMLVATSNAASIGIVNPPAVIYLLMITAAFSANPLWAAVLTALMAVLAIVLTYVFIRRYFGRVAATIATLTYAVAYRSVFYARFIWNQNFLHLFVVLFFFALFWGVVERRRGWLFPAIFLLGLMIQLHATGVLLAAPLLVAVLLAPDTIRWRDLLFGLLSLLLIYLPYLLWEISAGFSDLNLLLHPKPHPTILDNEALLFYQSYLSPFAMPLDRRSVLYQAAPWFGWVMTTLTALVIAGALLALTLVIWSDGKKTADSPAMEGYRPIWRRGIFGWWRKLRATPLRCGLLVLLIWQVAPLVYLSRHSLPLYPHYFIIFMPGQFLLFGFFIARVATWFRERGPRVGTLRYALYGLSALLIVELLVASTGQLVDLYRGNYGDNTLSQPYYNDLNSVESAMLAADALAIQHHFHNVYIATDDTQAIYQAMAVRMHTPTTLFDKRHCMLLPDPASGPAVMLVSPYNTITNDLLAHYARATLVSTPPHRGGDPYRLYIVQALPPTVTTPSPAHVFPGDLRLLDAHAQSAYLGKAQRLVMRWQLLHASAPSFSRVSYNYHFTVSAPGINREVAQGTCFLTSLHQGDELITALSQYVANPLPMPLSLRVDYREMYPVHLTAGPFKFETIKQQYTLLRFLRTGEHQERMLLMLT